MSSTAGKIAFLLFLFDLIIQGIYALPSDLKQVGTGCPSVGLPGNARRQANILHKTKPMFSLDTRTLKEGYIPGQTYTLYVRAQDSKKKFSDVLVWVDENEAGCSSGRFDTNPTYYHQPKNCSSMVLKNTKDAEHTFPVKWTAPNCGCVTIRARVSGANSGPYVFDDETTVGGHLTSYICPRGIDTILSQSTKVEKTDLLCKVIHGVSGAHLATRREVLNRRKMVFSEMSHLQKEAWKVALEQRMYNVKKCCGLKNKELTECLGNERRHRIDRFCAYGESIIPFTTKRLKFMQQKKSECCWRLGEHRYHCFAYIPQKDAGSHISLWNVQKADNLDEMDPLNDLEDYTEEVQTALARSNIFLPSLAEQEEKIKTRQKSEPVATPKKLMIKSITSGKKEKPVAVMPKTEEVTETTAVPVTSTVRETTITQTSKDLRRKMMRIKTKLECCEKGKSYGASVLGDPWEKCADNAFTFARQKKIGKRKCRTFYLKCCIEQSQSSERESLDDDDGDDDDIDESETQDVTESSVDKNDRPSRIKDDLHPVDKDDQQSEHKGNLRSLDRDDQDNEDRDDEEEKLLKIKATSQRKGHKRTNKRTRGKRRHQRKNSKRRQRN